MPARTIYVREEDEDIWRRAEELASNGSQSLSAIVTASLRFFVRTREERFGLVTLRVNRDETGASAPTREVQFAGLVAAAEQRVPGVVVYLTPKRNLIFWSRETSGLGAAGALAVFASLEEAQVATDAEGRPRYPLEVLAEAGRKLGSLDGRSIPNEAGTLAPPGWTETRTLDV